MKQVAEGVYVRGLQMDTILTGERTTLVQRFLYSENLLQIDQIAYIGQKNEAVQFWEAMRPMARAKEWDGTNIPVVVNDLRQWFLLRNSGAEIYCATMGRMVMEPTPVRLVHDNKLAIRKIYSIPLSHEQSRFVMQQFNYVVDDEQLLFFSPVKRTVSNYVGSWQVTFVFDIEHVVPIVELVSYQNKKLVMNTIWGTVAVVLDDTFNHQQIFDYLAAFASSWKEKWETPTLVDTGTYVLRGRPDPYVLPAYWGDKLANQGWMVLQPG
jgi:hypothetical protein